MAHTRSSSSTNTKRPDSDKWLIGDCLPIASEIDGVVKYSHYQLQLHSKREILKHVSFLRLDNKFEPLQNIIENVMKDVLEIWNNAAIPAQCMKTCISKAIDLYEHWDSLKKLKSRSSSKELQKRKMFCDELDSLFDIVSSEWEVKIKQDRIRSKKAIAEDLKFLEDQRGPRKMYIWKQF